MPSLPSGTVTFLFTDVEGSTKLWDDFPDQMRTALAKHDALLKAAIEENQGYLVKTTGDGVLAAFHTANDALNAVLQAQLKLLQQRWPEPLTIKARMGMHTGAAEFRDGDYFGTSLNRAARLMSAGHGGQVLLSDVTFDLCRDALPAGVSLVVLGEFRLKDLNRPEIIHQLRHPDLPDIFPKLRTLDNTDLPNNLPVQTTSFIGREAEIQTVKELLGKTRLLTMAGAGGFGKTRLSLQVAADVLEEYPDGVWFVELASLSEPTLVPQAVAQAVGIPEKSGQTILQTLVDALKQERTLLVLDNCEHLVSACAQLASVLLRSCPDTKLIATSREPLGIGGELTYRIPPLKVPNLGAPATPESLSVYESVQLFIERALFRKPDFLVTNTNAPSLAQLCHRLDGIPLTIELAAARIRSLSVEDINARLDSRFRLLTGGDRSAMPRQQTLRALVDWSYDLLNDSERVLLGRLSVFSGGWTLEAAESVCGFAPLEDWESLDLLTSLSDKSLVLSESVEGGIRYRMLETIREYGSERLAASGELAMVQERHGDFFLALAEEAEPQLRGHLQMSWLSRLEVEHDNLRAVLDGYGVPTASNDSEVRERQLRLSGALPAFWETRGHWAEGRERLMRVLETTALSESTFATTARAKCLLGAGILSALQGDYDTAWLRYEESLARSRKLGDKQIFVSSLIRMGIVAFVRGDYDVACSLYEESLSVSRELGNKQGIAHALLNSGNVAQVRGDYDTAWSLFEECLALFRELGDKQGIAIPLINMGDLAQNRGDYDTAWSLMEESLTLSRELGNKRLVSGALLNLGTVALHRGDYDTAWLRYEESLSVSRELGNKQGIAHALLNRGLVAEHRADYAVAWALYEESLTLLRELGDKNGIAVVLSNMGAVALCRGDYDTAWPPFEESLTIACGLNDRLGIAYSLEGVAAVYIAQSAEVIGVSLFGAAQALREVIGAPRSPKEQKDVDGQIAKARKALDEEAFAIAWEEGLALTWEEAVALALRKSPSLS